MNELQEEPFPLNDIQMGWEWGTYGKSGQKTLVYVPLHELETDHLINITRSQDHLYHIDRTGYGENRALHAGYVLTFGQLLYNRGFTAEKYLERCHVLMKEFAPDHINNNTLTMARILVRFEETHRARR